MSSSGGFEVLGNQPNAPMVEQISTAYTRWKSETGARMATELKIEPLVWGQIRGMPESETREITTRKFLGFLFGMKVYSDPTVKGWKFER